MELRTKKAVAEKYKIKPHTFYAWIREGLVLLDGNEEVPPSEDPKIEFILEQKRTASGILKNDQLKRLIDEQFSAAANKPEENDAAVATIREAFDAAGITDVMLAFTERIDRLVTKEDMEKALLQAYNAGAENAKNELLGELDAMLEEKLEHHKKQMEERIAIEMEAAVTEKPSVWKKLWKKFG